MDLSDLLSPAQTERLQHVQDALQMLENSSEPLTAKDLFGDRYFPSGGCWYYNAIRKLCHEHALERGLGGANQNTYEPTALGIALAHDKPRLAAVFWPSHALLITKLPNQATTELATEEPVDTTEDEPEEHGDADVSDRDILEGLLRYCARFDDELRAIRESIEQLRSMWE